MRVLVTGAAGFLGRHVVRALALRGDQIVALDRRPCFFASEDGRIASILADITDPGMGKHVGRLGLDVVIHLAAIAHPRECEADPAAAFAVNVGGTVNMLRLAVRESVRSFILASTAHCYGIPPLRMPTDETQPPWPQDAYTVSKILAEDACRLFHSSHGLGFTSLRLCNGYGPGQPEGYFVPDMVAQARSGRIDLVGAATTKDFLYVDDMVAAIVSATDTTCAGILNIGSGVETSLSDMATRIAAILGVPLLAVPGVTYGGRMCCDRSRAGRMLGWTPSWSMEDGLAATIRADGEAVP